MNAISLKSRNMCSVSMPTVFITLWVMLAFLSNIILNSFQGKLLTMLAALVAVLYVLSKRVLTIKLTIFDLHFLACWIVVLIGYFLFSQSSTLSDVIVLISGYAIVRCNMIDPKKFVTPMKIIPFFGIFFSVGVALNYFFPSLYNLCLGLFPTAFSNAVRTAALSSGQRTRGFTTNSGHTAGFIVIAIMVVFAQIDISKCKTREKFLIVFLFAALLLTGKRAHLLFIVITLALCYLLPVRGREKMRRYWNIFLFLSVLCVLITTFWDYLITIPFFSRLKETIQGLMIGEDVSSARNSLFSWALHLFKEDPLTGIGWNMYRTTVVGNATMATELDVHNIYLQLLCETGIIGFTLFVSFFAVLWIQTKDAYVECIHSAKNENSVWRVTLRFSFMFQTFFLLYGLTGNPLYDQSWQIIYMFSLAIYMGYRHVNK